MAPVSDPEAEAHAAAASKIDGLRLSGELLRISSSHRMKKMQSTVKRFGAGLRRIELARRPPTVLDGNREEPAHRFEAVARNPYEKRLRIHSS